VDTIPTSTPSVYRHRTRWTVLVGTMILGAAVYGTVKLYDYADPENMDPTPGKRPKINAPFITTPDQIINKMIEVAEISDKHLVYDLGCGDGRIVISAAVQRGCRGVGFDIDPVRVAEAQANAIAHGVEHLVTIQEQDIFNVDLSQADVLVMYLLPWMLRDLKPSFDRCRPGTRIVSHDFEIENVEANETVEVFVTPTLRHYVRLYITPLKELPEKPKWKPRT